MRITRLTWVSLLVLTIVLATTGTALAQLTTGNLYGGVTDEQGAALPGVAMTLTGPAGTQTQVSDTAGAFRFLSLAIGNYQLRAELEDFSTVEVSAIVIVANRNTTIADLTLSSVIAETITVTTEAPVLDERKITAGTTITQMELDKIPTARDPWSLLAQTPGVQVDRINVGGNESGQQSMYVSAGSSTDDTTWAVDGVNITDMTSISSPSYFDFEAFEQVQFITGGNDVTTESSGVTVNVVTKRGTNEWRGSGRYLRTDGDWQSDPDIDSGDAGVNNSGVRQNLANFIPSQINLIEEYGAEVGGPIVRDRLWIWGAYGKNEIGNLVAGTGQLDFTELENSNLKLNAQIAASNSATVQYSENDKIKSGRGAGATRAPSTTTDQSGVGGKPSDILKVEDSHIFSSNFFLTGAYSFVDGGFQLVPKAGVNAPAWQDENGVYQGGYYVLFNNRDVTQYKLDSSVFFPVGATNNELKFGASHRLAETSSNFGISGGGALSYSCQVRDCGDDAAPTTGYVNLFRQSNSVDESEFDAFWIQDTLTAGNLTANLGVRYEKATGRNLPSTIPGVVYGGITFLPGISSAEIDPSLDFEAVMPRLGLTYALGEERKTLLRVSLSRFNEQYLSGNHTRLSSLGGNSVLTCLFNDANGNGFLDNAEAASIDTSACEPTAFDPLNPTNTRSPNVTDPNLEPAKTDELLLNFERALMPEFVVSVGALYRNVSDISELRPLLRENGVVRVAQRGDYVERVHATSGLHYFERRAGVTSAGGTVLTNGDREQQAFGLTLGATKRMSNRWMARGHLQYTDWTWDVPDSYFDHVDPTNLGDAAGTIASGDRDGEVVAERSGGSGSKGSIFLNAKWSASLTALYQVAPDAPWGFNLGTAINARQGYPNPPFRNIAGADGVNRAVAVTSSIDSRRNDNVVTADLRLEKEVNLGDVGLTFGLDVFNVFNDNTVLQRQRSQTSGSYNFITETISPRVLRAGVRLSFN